MSESHLTLYRRGSHNPHYDEFQKFCEGEEIPHPHFEEYGLTPEEAAAVLRPTLDDRKRRKRGKPPAGPTILLECSLPMAMALLSRQDDFKIVAFLDLAKVERREGSCSIYHLRSAKDANKKGKEAKLLVPSHQSMTAIFGARYIRRGMQRTYTYGVEHNTFDKIIDFLRREVVEGHDLSDYVWVLDEVNRKKNERYSKDLTRALGNKSRDIEKKDLFKWAFDQYAHGEAYENYEIPGMVLVASEEHLKEKPQRITDVDRFLKTWQKYRDSKPGLVESKSLGPFGWTDLEDMRGLLRLAALIARLADGVVGIERSLQVHKDFFDVAPLAHPDNKEGVEALQNFSAALETELLEWSAVATAAPGHLNEATINLEKRKERAVQTAAQVHEIYEDMHRCRSSNPNPELVQKDYEKLETICKQASDVQDDLSRAFGQVESTADGGIATLYWGGRRKTPQKL